MRIFYLTIVILCTFSISNFAQITAEITNYNCNSNTYDVEFAVSGAQQLIFNDLFFGYDAVSLNGYDITDCYDASLLQTPPCICTFLYAPVCACNGLTYSNDCFARECAGYEILFFGECDGSELVYFTVHDIPVNTGDIITITSNYLDGNNNTYIYETIILEIPANNECAVISNCACPDLIDSQVFCPAVIDPVCGCDGKTYSNSCIAQYGFGIPSWTKGECGNTSGNIIYAICDDGNPNTINDKYDENCNCMGELEQSCICPETIDNNVICNSVFNPVCGCDGITYSNACQAQYYNGVVSWTSGPCNNTSQDTTYGNCDDFNQFTNNDHYGLNCTCSGFLSGCICENLIDLDATITTEFDPVCGCNGLDYGNPSAAQNAGVIKWTNGPCAPCSSNPISYLWVQKVLDEVQSFCFTGSDVKLYTADYNGTTIIVIAGLYGFDFGIEYLFSCSGDLIQSCTTTIAGYECQLDANIDINNLVLKQIFDVCEQSYIPSTSITRTCDDGNPATMNDQYDDNCNCIGQSNCIDEVFPMITICEANLSSYNGPSTDPNNDGVLGWQGGTNWIDGDNVAIIQNGNCTYTQSINIDIIFIGETCDDGNPDTMNDVIQADCMCIGITDPCLNITDENFGAFSICNVQLPLFDGPIGDPNNDGTAGWQGNTNWVNGINSIEITDANGCVYTQQVILNIFNVGDSCDDGNPLTINDTIDTDCQCRGQIISVCECPDLIDLAVPCTAVYDPVCGCDNVTYSNSCVAQYHNGIPGWTPGECDTTNSNLIINAVCNDFNDFTFDDYINDSCLCVGYLKGCRCPDLIDPDRICPTIYDPVCGCDGVTYSNSCLAESNGVINWTIGACKNCNDDPMTYIWLQNIVDSLKLEFCPAMSMEVRIANYNGNQIIIIQAVIGIDFTFDWIFDCKGQMIQNCMVTIAGVVCLKPAGIDLSTITSTKIFDICTGNFIPATIQYYQCLINGVPGYYDESCNCILSTSTFNHKSAFFNVYPNPANAYITVDFEGISPIEIINVNGDKVLETIQKNIDISQLSSGIYFVKINNQIKQLIITK